MSAYVKGVLSGEIIASRWVKMACQRHLDDLKRKDLVWDLEGAERVFRFFQNVLKLSGGQFENKPFVLEPFEQFIVGSLFGWKLEDGTRRFRKAYIEIGKGNGKSPLAAGIGMYGLIADKEPRAEIYAAATKKDQAMILFRDAAAMRDLSDHLKARLQKSGVGEKCWNLADHRTGSWFRPISSDEDSQSGPRPHMALIDEVHEHKSPVVITMLEKGFKFRRNPLMIMITNSGSNRESVCFHQHQYGTEILKKVKSNDRFFIFICALDSCEEHWAEGQEQPVDNCEHCDDWRVEGPHWAKANPALDVIVKRETIADNVRTALDMPSEENETRRLNFCFWTASATRWISMQAWDSCGKPIDYEALRGRSCVVGLDLANTIDIAAMVLLFPPDRIPTLIAQPEQAQPAAEPGPIVSYRQIDIEKLAEDFIVLPYFWIPRDRMTALQKADQVPYDSWVKAGVVEATEGNVIDYQAIKQKLVALKDIYPIRTVWSNGKNQHLVGFDPWNGTEFANDMAARFGINMIQVRQGFQTMSEPTKQMARLALAKKLCHGRNPVLRWMADNVMVRTDPAGNVKPDKEKSKKKIDGIVALIIALAVCIQNAGAASGSYYDTHELRVI